MAFFRSAWYVALWSEALAPGAIEKRRILSEDVVLFRDPDGAPVALRDLCPHRFAPLSLGRLTPNGIACSYHGLEFGVDGQCIANPHTSGRIPSKACVRKYPVVERDTLVWIWMGDADQADPALIPDFSFLDLSSGLSVTKRDAIQMPCRYELIIDNLLDLSHISFLHEGILGHLECAKSDIRTDKSDRHVQVERISRNVRVPEFFELLLQDGSERGDQWNTIYWHLPSTLINDVVMTAPGADPMDGTGILGAHLLTPVDEHSTLYHIAAARQKTRRPINPETSEETRQRLADIRRFAFEEQDLPMIAAQARNLREYPAETRHGVFLDIDAGPAMARAMLRDSIAWEAAGRDREASSGSG